MGKQRREAAEILKIKPVKETWLVSLESQGAGKVERTKTLIQADLDLNASSVPCNNLLNFSKFQIPHLKQTSK